MKKLINTVFIIVLLVIITMLFSWYMRRSSIPLILSKTDVLEVLYTVAGTKDIVITPLKGGMSESVLYKIDSNNNSYVIRIIEHSSKASRQREINAQAIASENGWGPKLYASDINQGWIIMEYIKPTLLTHIDRMDDEIYKALGKILHKIHTGPDFLSVRDRLNEIEERLKRAYRESKIPQFINYAVLAKIIDSVKKNHSTILAPTHRDLNPNNIIFSGHRPFIIDLEDAAQDDPFYDLGTVGIFYVFDSHHEQVFLHAYFNRVPTEQEHLYYQSMKQAARLCYGLNFLEAAPGGIINNVTIEPEPFEKILQDFTNGTIGTTDSIDQLKIAVSLLQEAINEYNV